VTGRAAAPIPPRGSGARTVPPCDRDRYPGAVRIVHVASECVPYSKTGGLADVVGSLPAALAARGHRVVTVTPLHRPDLAAPLPGEPAGQLEVGGFRFGVRREVRRSVVHLLLDCPRLFARPAPYGTPDGDYPDNPVRFAALCRGAIAAAARELPGTDVIHCHDWQAALVPVLLGRDPALGSTLAGTPTVLTIHNLAYQGDFPPWAAAAAAIPPELVTPEGVEFWGRVNFLKGGILAADRLVTVSPTYAREILTPEAGCGLHEVLAARADHLTGILNGLDTGYWNPTTDPHLPRRYSARSVTAGKRAAAAALAAELGLDADGSPLLGMVSRLVAQKGADLVAAALDGLVDAGFRIAVLGSGDPDMERELAAAAARHPGRAALRTGFHEPLAHRIYAAADGYLMPSRFEPCGLAQMIAMRYGALPVVRPTGGLADTVRDLERDPDTGTGLWIADPTPAAVVAACRRALQVLADPARLLALRRRIMTLDWSWERPAAAYEALYRDLARAEP